MNIDKDKLIEFSAETRKTFTNAKLRVGSDDKRTVHIFTDDELSEFADLVSALAIASLQGHTHKNGCVSVPIEPTDAMLKSARVRINQHTNIFTKQLKNYTFDTKG